MDRVLIFPNGPLKRFLKDTNQNLSSPYKYYVGVTRPRYSLAFVVDRLQVSDCFKKETLEIGFRRLNVTKFSVKSSI